MDLYEITVLKGGKRIYQMEVQARDGINALEKAAVRFTPDRIVHIRPIPAPRRIERPAVSRPERDAVI